MTDDASAETADECLDAAEQRSTVRERYARIAADTGSCCGDGGDGTAPANADTNATSADANATGADANATSVDAAVQSCDPGYSDEDRDAAGSDAELSFGCGNPTAIAGLDEVNTVVDLGEALRVTVTRPLADECC